MQGILAPIQFLVFLVSLWPRRCAISRPATGFAAATASIVVKTLVLYTIMITGSIWEHDVFGRYLFAPAFFWEDVVSMLVLALHTAYLVALFTGWLDPREQMLLALAAYASYVVNADAVPAEAARARLERRLPAAFADSRAGGPPDDAPGSSPLRAERVARRRAVERRSCASAASARYSAA